MFAPLRGATREFTPSLEGTQKYHLSRGQKKPKDKHCIGLIFCPLDRRRFRTPYSEDVHILVLHPFLFFRSLQLHRYLRLLQDYDALGFAADFFAV